MNILRFCKKSKKQHRTQMDTDFMLAKKDKRLNGTQMNADFILAKDSKA
jgi:hypothetical protein